tara:strand:+ start:427 stop:666 length:240 start_codon:yes stop_codon:yes gene_type:complete
VLDDNIIARHVRQALREYLNDLDGENSIGIRDMVVESVEKPVIETILEHVEGNQTRAAAMLGLNRNTLRKKIKIYKIKM